MSSRTQWLKLPETSQERCACGEQATRKNREIFLSGNTGVWQYLCESHALAYNGHRELPDMPTANVPPLEEIQKTEWQERDSQETDGPKTEVDKLLDEL